MSVLDLQGLEVRNGKNGGGGHSGGGGKKRSAGSRFCGGPSGLSLLLC